MSKRMEVKILGRTIGTASGWDQVADEIVMFYGFKSTIESLASFKDGIAFDYLNGWIETYKKDGAVDKQFDVFEVLATVERDKE